MNYFDDLVLAVLAAMLIELMKVPFRYFQHKDDGTKNNIEQKTDGS